MHSAKNGSMNTIYFFVGSSNFQEYEIYQVEQGATDKLFFILADSDTGR